MHRELPTGSVTLLFTDIEGSTRLLNELGAKAYNEALAEHRRLLRRAFTRHGGVEVDTQGDAFFYAFPSAPEAIDAAGEGQEALSGPIRVRMGLHTGRPHVGSEGYVGEDVHLAARIAAAGHGGQVLVSQATRGLVDGELADLGEHKVKDFSEPVWIFQLGEERFPPLKTISNTNLPRPASSFVGREREVSGVVRLLTDDARLVTLSGPGGSGKTRLAIESAAELVPEFRNGVFWVGLAALRDPALVAETVSQILGAKAGLVEHIGERELLLLLDNFEHVVDAAPELGSLLESCPNLRILVTSRERLRIRGEVEYPVPPLAHPEAVELFCARSQLQRSDEIADLCRRLDNLPLGVELAAARTSVLTPAQILERLSQRLDLLRGGRDAEARQQSLRATIAWSYELLTEEERRLFARFSVFAGGCTLEAAADVAEADLDTLQSLVDKSLIRPADGRFWMLETIREFALERLDQGDEAETLYERLARYLIDLVAAEDPPLFLGREATAFARFEQEHPNTRAVMNWAIRRRRHEFVLELVASLFMFWVGRPHLIEARGWAESALQARGHVPDGLWLRALVGASEIFSHRGDLARATTLKEELIAQAADGEAADPLLVPAALVNLADIALEEGDLERARELAEQSLRLRNERGLNPARALQSLGELALREGDLDQAERLLKQAAQGFATLQHEENYAWTLEALGEVARQRGAHERAAGLFVEALQRAAAIGDQSLAGECLQGLAVIESDAGQADRAARLWGAGRALRQLTGSSPTRPRKIGDLPEQQHAEGARMSLEEVIRFASESHD